MKNVFLQLKCTFPMGGFSIGGSPWGVLHLGAFSIGGVLHLGRVLHLGFSIWGGSPSRGGSPSGGALHPGGVLHPGGSPSGGSPSRGALHLGGSQVGGAGGGGFSIQGGVPYDLSHHAFDVTCMLPAHQLRPTNSAAAYILLVM